VSDGRRARILGRGGMAAPGAGQQVPCPAVVPWLAAGISHSARSSAAAQPGRAATLQAAIPASHHGSTALTWAHACSKHTTPPTMAAP
jgi:hypothetical protein